MSGEEKGPRVSTLKSNYLKLIQDKRAKRAQEAYEQAFEKDIMSRQDMEDSLAKQKAYEQAAEDDIAGRGLNDDAKKAMGMAEDLDSLGESDIAEVDAIAEKQKDKMDAEKMKPKKKEPKPYEKKKSPMKMAEEASEEALIPSGEGHWMDRYHEKTKVQDAEMEKKRKKMMERRKSEMK